MNLIDYNTVTTTEVILIIFGIIILYKIAEYLYYKER